MSRHETYDTAPCRAARKDCIDRQGDCKGCPHAVPSLGDTCMIRFTPQVVKALGGATLEASFGIGATCQECGEDFIAMTTTARYCNPCKQERQAAALRVRRATIKANRATQPCAICQASFTPFNNQQRYCDGCKGKGLRIYECSECRGEYVSASRQRYTRRCEKCKTAQQQSA